MLGEGGKSLLNFLCLLRKLLAGKTGKAGTNEKKKSICKVHRTFAVILLGNTPRTSVCAFEQLQSLFTPEIWREGKNVCALIPKRTN